MLLIMGVTVGLEWSKWRDPGGSAFPAGLMISFAACLAAGVLTVSALRRRRSATVIVLSIVNGVILALYISDLVISALTIPQ